MGACRNVFVLIQQKLAEKTNPGRIPTIRGRISVFFRPSPGKQIFSREVVPYLPAVRPTSEARLNFPSYIFMEN